MSADCTRHRPLFNPRTRLADAERIDQLERQVETGSPAQVRKAARELVLQVRMRAWLHGRLLAGIRVLDEQDRVAASRKRITPMEGP